MLFYYGCYGKLSGYPLQVLVPVGFILLSLTCILGYNSSADILVCFLCRLYVFFLSKNSTNTQITFSINHIFIWK
ncbi:hypothetical protein HMPREF0969_00743 [Bacteroides sp. D20]|nr:hypothetical protein HMPREF0969_00743 [Bacteroides sp. D20]